jgi:hypothetical protein
MADIPPEELNNADFEESAAGLKKLAGRIDAGAWQRLRDWLYGAREVQ